MHTADTCEAGLWSVTRMLSQWGHEGISAAPRDSVVPPRRERCWQQGTPKPSFQALCFSQPRGGTGMHTGKSHAILIRTCITTSWHKIQKIKLKKRNWFTSKSALTDGMYTHRSFTCWTDKAHFWAPTSQNTIFTPDFPFSKQHLSLYDCIFLARQHLRLQIAVHTLTGRKIRTGFFL